MQRTSLVEPTTKPTLPSTTVLAVFEGHAFTGYLTEDEQLPSVVVLDQPTAVTIADSDFFDAVETTVLCRPRPSFDDARDATSRWWSSDVGKLRSLKQQLDVLRGRYVGLIVESEADHAECLRVLDEVRRLGAGSR